MFNVLYKYRYIIIINYMYYTADINITKGPQDTTVCMNDKAECLCGFTGDNNFLVPSWRVVLRNDDGNVISNVTHTALDISTGHISGLQWSPDLISGDNNAPNSKLLVGPVNKTHNQSSYQCSFISADGQRVISSSRVGTMTIVGKTALDYEIL